MIFTKFHCLEAGEYPLNYEKIELCALVTDILTDNHSVFYEKQIEPKIEIPTEEPSKLLERFYVADISRNKGTSGQELYIVK